ncbi:MAG TPA: tetratricopeptide repeat protein [Nitrospirae bacterium]|nr:tetratricopeptide repeat protein [Nitrospirota bacterium]
MKLEKKPQTDEEKIVTTITELKEQFREKQKNLVYLLVGSLSVVLILSVVYIYTTSSKSKAAEFEAEGYKYFYGARGNDAQLMYLRALEAFKNAYNTRKSAYALLYIANCYVELGKFDDAITTLNDLISNFSDPINLSFAYHKLSWIYMKKEDYQKAISTLENLKKIKGAALQDLAYFQSAIIWEMAGKTEQAQAEYKELIVKFPNSPLTSQAKAKIK